MYFSIVFSFLSQIWEIIKCIYVYPTAQYHACIEGVYYNEILVTLGLPWSSGATKSKTNWFRHKVQIVILCLLKCWYSSAIIFSHMGHGEFEYIAMNSQGMRLYICIYIYIYIYTYTHIYIYIYIRKVETYVYCLIFKRHCLSQHWFNYVGVHFSN